MQYNKSTVMRDFDIFLSENACVTNGDIVSVLEEDAKPYAVDKTLDNIFESMLEKYSKINFEDIPNTKGDIIKWKHHPNMLKCIAALTNINKNTGKLPQADVLDSAVKNIMSLEPIFKEGFMRKNPYVILQYNVMVYSVFQATSTIISSVLDFVQNGTSLNASVIEYKGSENIMIINTLSAFNSAVKDGSYKEMMHKAIETQSIKHESITLAGIAAAWKMAPLAIKIIGGLWASTKIVPLTKQLIFLIYSARTRISDAANVQAEFLAANIESLNKNNPNMYTEEQLKKIIEKQSKIRNAFSKIARFFAVKNDHAEQETKRDMQHETKYNADEFVI